MSRVWREAELDYLQDMWGSRSIPSIAQRLGRSVGGVRQKAHDLGLGPHLESGDYVTANALMRALGYCGTSGKHCLDHWGKHNGLPIHYKRVNTGRFLVVYIDEFWEWAYKHRSMVNFAKMEPLILGKEPPWVKAQRRKDARGPGNWYKRWDDQEDRLLLELVKSGAKYAEIAERMDRPLEGVRARCKQLGIKADKKILTMRAIKWTDEELEAAKQAITDGDGWGNVADAVGRTEDAVKRKFWQDYGTVKRDELRKLFKTQG